MCRFTFYQGVPIRVSSLVAEPEHALIKQSFSAKLRLQGNLNGDGFGLAWYDKKVKPDPAIFRSISPAWNNSNLLELANMIDSNCILAHVRAATQSFEVTEANCHPFKFGNYTFMHNGDIGSFDKLRRPLLGELTDPYFQMLKGNTDSEHLFALIMQEIGDQSNHLNEVILQDCLISALGKLESLRDQIGLKDHCHINAVLTNGYISLIVRYAAGDMTNAPSLFFNSGNRYECKDGVCYMVDPGYETKSVIVSSEPLSNDQGWQEVPTNTIMVVRDGKIVIKNTEINLSLVE